jgi:hypothetical protein
MYIVVSCTLLFYVHCFMYNVVLCTLLFHVHCCFMYNVVLCTLLFYVHCCFMYIVVLCTLLFYVHCFLFLQYRCLLLIYMFSFVRKVVFKLWLPFAPACYYTCLPRMCLDERIRFVSLFRRKFLSVPLSRPNLGLAQHHRVQKVKEGRNCACINPHVNP